MLIIYLFVTELENGNSLSWNILWCLICCKWFVARAQPAWVEISNLTWISEDFKSSKDCKTSKHNEVQKDAESKGADKKVEVRCYSTGMTNL